MLRWINNSLNAYPNKQHRKQEQDRFVTQNIPGQILELEFQCQSQSTSKELIAKLTQLYKVAIQYYQSKNENKYRIYRKRMKIFLEKQNIDDILRGKQVKLVTIKQEAEKKFSDARLKSKGEANRLLEQLEKLQKTNHTIIENSLKAQQNQLHQRIRKRRTMSNCSTRTKDEQDNQECTSPTKKAHLDFILEGMASTNKSKVKKVFI